MGREKCAQYWPSDRSARYQCFVVDPLAEYNMPQYLLREFKVTDARDGSSRTVRQFQFTDWPEQGKLHFRCLVSGLPAHQKCRILRVLTKKNCQMATKSLY